MDKIYNSAGHSSKLGVNAQGKKIDNGAVGGKWIEGVETEVFRNLVVKELKNLGVDSIVDGSNTVLADTMKEFKKTADENSILIEYHFNAASPQATGTEVLIPNNPTVKEKEIAVAIAKSISETLGIKNRGVKTESESARGSLGFMRIAGSNILPEICFISNKTDMEKYQVNKNQLAKNIAKILYDAANKNKQRVHTVISGDTLSKIAQIYRTTITKIKTDNLLSSDLIKVGQKLKV